MEDHRTDNLRILHNVCLVDSCHLLTAILLSILKSITSNTFRVFWCDNLHAFHNTTDTLKCMINNRLLERNLLTTNTNTVSVFKTGNKCIYKELSHLTVIHIGRWHMCAVKREAHEKEKWPGYLVNYHLNLYIQFDNLTLLCILLSPIPCKIYWNKLNYISRLIGNCVSQNWMFLFFKKNLNYNLFVSLT